MFGRKKALTSVSSRRPLQKSVVFFSLLEIACLVICCSGERVVQNQRTTTSNIRPGSTAGNTNTQTRRVMHPAFENAGREAGLQIWRIENFEPVVLPQRDYGKFYTGDSYIILNTRKNKNNQLFWDVHFWLGSETSQDEAGAAAILTVQLDDLLNGDPIQHREVQDHESSQFLSYFRSGLRYEKGGVGSGFRHIEPNSPGEKRLFQVKGKRNVRVRQVNLSVSSMNKGDCFILDAGNDIYVYVGSSAKRIEKIKATSAANQIRDQDHNGRARIQIIDEFSTETDKQNFFVILGSGSPNEVPDESTADEDAAFEANEERIVTLYKVTDQAGVLKVETISTKPLRQEMLDTNDCFILDTGSGSGLYVWIGKGATPQEKSQSMIKAQEFLSTNKYPAWTQVHRIVEGAESATFKQYFATWRDAGMAHPRLVRAIDVSPEEILPIKIKSAGHVSSFMPDNANGTIVEHISYITNATINREKYDSLLTDQVDVIKYNYLNKNNKESVIKYCWMGKDSSEENRKSSGLYTLISLANEIPLSPITIRMPQGHELKHFRKIFQGKLFIRNNEEDGLGLYRVRGTEDDDVVTEQLPLTSSSLASDDSFIIVLPDKCFVWNGLGASDFEKNKAENVASTFNENVDIINEGTEPEEFWDSLGGKSTYDTRINPPGPPILDPRLFHCTITNSGRIIFEEIKDFEQEDLDKDEIMVLDADDVIYIWVGRTFFRDIFKNNNIFQWTVAMEYFRYEPTERTEHTTPIITFKQGDEPESFRLLFPEWDHTLWNLDLDTFEELKAKISEMNNLLGDL